MGIGDNFIYKHARAVPEMISRAWQEPDMGTQRTFEYFSVIEPKICNSVPVTPGRAVVHT